MEPYRGLQPYTEENEDIFFGREAEKAILIDKILSEKLSLLFAATGVGKSSLLQAAVMPELKRPARENLDVVYYNDWVTDPLHGLPQKILDVLRERGKIAADFLITHPLAPSLWKREGENETAPLFPSLSSQVEENEPDSSSPLSFPKRGGQGVSFKDFLHICATFASEPLVIILDQFEEFFQYHRYQATFTPFITQLAEAIRDRATSVVFLISMREDFALNLNEFKGYLPTTLFENYYRLEKLGLRAAEEAIAKPVEHEKVGFRYEQGLIQTLLKDLADQERENRIGSQKALLPENAPVFVEPPNVQIVCQQLWELEQHTPEKIIRAKTYNEKGGAKGFINVYFEGVIAGFSASEKKLASLAFNHLVTPHGTKMAYPVKDLSELLRVNETALGNVLAKLEKKRILRSQSREGIIWYELYHDIFSGIIQQWNTRYKEQQRNRRALIGVGLAALTLLCLVVAYDVGINLTSHYLRVSLKTDQAGQYLAKQIEVYRGKAGSWDLFGLQRYVAEADYGHQDLEPDKFFSAVKPVAAYQNLNAELIGQFPIVDRVQAYWQNGEIKRAMELADKSINPNDVTRSQAVIPLLASFPSEQAFTILQKHVQKSTDGETIRTCIAGWLGYYRFPGAVDCLLALLKDINNAVRSSAAGALGQIKSERAVEPLLLALQDQNVVVWRDAAEALGALKSERAVDPLIKALQGQNVGIQYYAAAALGALKSERAVDPLIKALQDQDANVRHYAAVAAALGALKSERVVDPLIKALQDQNVDVRGNAAAALRQIKSERAVDPLIKALQEDQDVSVRQNAAAALRWIGNERAVDPLIKALQEDQDESVRQSAATALGWIGNERAVDLLLKALQDQNRDVRQHAAAALGQIKSERVVDPLLKALQDQNWQVRQYAALALGQIKSERVVDPLLKALQDQNWQVRQYAAAALGTLKSERVVDPLLKALQEDQDADVRRNAAAALGTLKSERVVDLLLKALQEDQDADVRRNAAAALGTLKSERVVDPLLKALQEDQEAPVRENAADALGALKSERAVDPLIKALQAQKAYTRENAAAAALARLEVSPILYAQFQEQLTTLSADELAALRAEVKQADADRRREIAGQLGKSPSPTGNDILLAMFADQDADVKVKVITALGQAKVAAALPQLHDLLADANFDIHDAVVTALAEIAAPESLDVLKGIALNPEERYTLRLNAIEGLGNIGTEAAATALLDILAKAGDSYIFRTVQALGYTRSKHALSKLLDMLHEQESRTAQWRSIRDENTDKYTDKQMEDWRKRLNAVAPQLTLEFELAHSIAMIEPEAGVKLLSHDLAIVRNGAWMGLARLPLTKTQPFSLIDGPAAVNLIERLDHERMASGNPFFKHAAYRAIDEMLIAIEAYGRKPELDALQAFRPNVQDPEGVKTRVEWTIDRLKEREEKK